MQKEYCREFIFCHSDWELIKEVYEKGVSGFKKSAKDRDAIQEIQQYAVKGEFDVLLVYMFDRLGRKEGEPPFEVEWFVGQGVEVWSAMEGQQFDTPIDKRVTKLDGIIDEVIRYQLDKIKMSCGSEVIAEQNQKAIELSRARYKMAEMQLSDKAKELSDYQAKTIRVIRGESRLSTDLLNELVEKTKAEIQTLSATVEAAKKELAERMESATQEQREFEKLQSWADLYDNCTFAAKKMIVSQFIKAVYVYRDYRIEVEFNVSFGDFQALSANCRNDGNEKTTVYLAETEKSRPA